VSENIELQVEDALEDKPRLDQYLCSKLAQINRSGFSRSRIQKLIDDQRVLVDNKPCKAALRLAGGETISLAIPEPAALELKAEDIPLKVVFEDETLIVIDKAAGQVVHPGAGVQEGTLVNALLKHCQGKLPGICGTMRPGIVHRLDKDTSGLLVVAKTDHSQLNLAAQIASRQARRIYLALLEGQPPADSGFVDQPIGRHKTDRKRMAISESGRVAQTYFEVIRHFQKFSLAKASLKTGRTHQIRVHMASLNCPVVGDIVYNKKSTGSLAARKKLGLSGHALHATYLSFSHPDSGLLLEFESKLPDDFQHLIDGL
jgi:23S rRNA pseudouridine1911/1915/1917 synthase